MCFAPSAPMPPSAWPSNVVSWDVAASCTFGRWLETLEHPQSRCWLCTGLEAIILWSFPVPCELGHWFWGPAFSHCAGSYKLCNHHSLKIPEEATMLNYTTDVSAIISEVFFFSALIFLQEVERFLFCLPQPHYCGSNSLILQTVMRDDILKSLIPRKFKTGIFLKMNSS